MANVVGANGFNNLLFKTNLIAVSNDLEHLKGHTPLDLRFKGYENINKVINANRSQINGKHGDIIYMPTAKFNKPDYSHDARIDPTILNSVRDKLVEVSGRLIPNKDLRRKTDTDITQKPLTPVGVVL